MKTANRPLDKDNFVEDLILQADESLGEARQSLETKARPLLRVVEKIIDLARVLGYFPQDRLNEMIKEYHELVGKTRGY